jgi:hypothetical protein
MLEMITAMNEQSCPALQREAVPVSPKMKRRSTGECRKSSIVSELSVGLLPQKDSTLQTGYQSAALGTPEAVQDSDATAQNPMPSADPTSFPKLRSSEEFFSRDQLTPARQLPRAQEASG